MACVPEASEATTSNLWDTLPKDLASLACGFYRLQQVTEQDVDKFTVTQRFQEAWPKDA